MAAVVLIVLPVVTFVLSYLIVSVPSPNDIKTNQVATIFGDDGKTIITRVIPPEGNRTSVQLNQVPKQVQEAVLAAEDRTFYTNAGFSVSGFARALRDHLLGRESAGGGSTITQQYVKNALVGSDRTIFRKMHELVVSTKMAREWSKDDILAAYLNTIYFGRGAYGIAAASKAYFNKPVEKLTVAEGAVLAASIQLPTALDPETNPTGAKNRWNYVLDGMVSMGNLPAAERAKEVYPTDFVKIKDLPNPAEDAGPKGLLKAQIIKELNDNGITEQQLNTEGLQIVSTISAPAQEAAEQGVKQTLDGQPSNLRAAVVSIDPRTGAVRAYYGGDKGAGLDWAQAALQTGSSFKTYGLAANLEAGKSLATMYDSSPLSIYGVTINNSEGASCGVCTIAEATKRSLNTSFVRMELALDDGPNKVKDMAHRVGVASSLPGIKKTLEEQDGSGTQIGVILGQYQTRPLDMASGYATFAASGVYHKPYFVQKVTTADGAVLLDRKTPKGDREVSAAVADNVTAALRPIAAYSNNHQLAGGRPSAAKTGTAQYGDTGQNKDGWMVGYTPSLATAVWVGSFDAKAALNSWGGSIWGSTLPSDIWKYTMDGALEGTDIESFPTPAPINGVAGVPDYSGPTTSKAADTTRVCTGFVCRDVTATSSAAPSSNPGATDTSVPGDTTTTTAGPFGIRRR
nr:transglycosylase domain-containing protein [Smaragdicoccus niigatensis]